jgi:electron transport complex protein RnfD
MAEQDKQNGASTATVKPQLKVEPGPHVHTGSMSTRGMMLDVIVALVPLMGMAVYLFRQYALLQLGVCIGSCLAAETLFTAMRKKPLSLGDGSAVVTGMILALSLPASAPWYVGLIGSFVAIAMGKVIFGGLGHNIFNPAMVGRAFVMIAFPSLLGASAYIVKQAPATLDVLTQATPLTAYKMAGDVVPLMKLVLGNTNGSLGETSALACIIGGVYLCLRRTASWEIPAGVLLAVAAIGGAINLAHTGAHWTVLSDLAGGALLFGAFFIATDPVSSPVTPKGKWIFGIGVGIFIMIIRTLSGYPEGVMFSVLLMNMIVPLINRWTVPTPVGGAVPQPKSA